MALLHGVGRRYANDVKAACDDRACCMNQRKTRISEIGIVDDELMCVVVGVELVRDIP